MSHFLLFQKQHTHLGTFAAAFSVHPIQFYLKRRWPKFLSPEFFIFLSKNINFLAIFSE